MGRLNVLLVVDLHNATPWQRQDFERGMADLKWLPMDKDGWFATEMTGVESDRDVLDQSEFDLKRSAAGSGISSWDSVCLLGEAPADQQILNRGPAAD